MAEAVKNATCKCKTRRQRNIVYRIFQGEKTPKLSSNSTEISKKVTIDFSKASTLPKISWDQRKYIAA